MSARDDGLDPLELLRRAEDATPPVGAQERILARLSASSFGAAAGGGVLAGSAPGGGAAVVVSGSLRQLARRFATWSLLPLAAGIVIGVNGEALLGREHARRAPPSSATAAGIPSTPAPLPAATVAPLTSALPPSLAVESAASGVAPPNPSSKLAPQDSRSGDSLAQERALLDRARQKLSVSEPEHALQFLEQHARRYPNGRLSEEREAMLINVLVSLGDVERAQARGAAFAKRYPTSLMRTAVKAALAAHADNASK
ncbi:MAG TPA: hypothetical protein VFK05_33495 [Polyangiaceae bacterium]|nr:hypothetical protein [Polyangiaceae bacterium]